MWVEKDIRKTVGWSDSKEHPHWELSLNGYTLTCDMADVDYRETVNELLALANEE